MSSLSVSDVKKLAELSALQLTDQEVAEMTGELGSILDYVAQLQAVDTADVAPTYQVNRPTTVDRPDELIDYGVSPDQLLAGAAEQRDHQIVVPKVVG